MQQIWVKVEGRLDYNSLIYSLQGYSGKQLVALSDKVYLFALPARLKRFVKSCKKSRHPIVRKTCCCPLRYLSTEGVGIIGGGGGGGGERGGAAGKRSGQREKCLDLHVLSPKCLQIKVRYRC
jgi:hypothetical protein